MGEQEKLDAPEHLVKLVDDLYGVMSERGSQHLRAAGAGVEVELWLEQPLPPPMWQEQQEPAAEVLPSEQDTMRAALGIPNLAKLRAARGGG